MGMAEFGDFIRRSREQRGFASQVAFAKAIGREQSYVSRIERGAIRELPPPSELRHLAETLGVTVEALLVNAGYLDPASEGASLEVLSSDPRAGLLRVIEGATDAEVRMLTRIAEVLVER